MCIPVDPIYGIQRRRGRRLPDSGGTLCPFDAAPNRDQTVRGVLCYRVQPSHYLNNAERIQWSER